MASTETSAPTELNLEEALCSCVNDPNFAIICAFLQKFGSDLGIDLPNFKQLQDWLTKTDEVAPPLRDMHIKLLRKTRKTVHEKSWESALSKFCFTYSAQDAWEIERFGYKNSSIKVKLRILRELLEGQFERNSKFRAKILAQNADSLRSEPIGRDRLGHAYWMTQDNDCNLRIYQEHLDEEIWQVVATSRDEFVNLIERLRGNEVVLPSTDIGIIDEDTSSSNSLSALDQKGPPPEERDDSQEDEQKVPKLSIKLVNGRSPKEVEMKDVGKGEEELAAEEDARLMKKTLKDSESCEEEFEEIEEEYEDETDDEDTRIEKNEDKTTKQQKTVEPLLISQSKMQHSTSTVRKRPLDHVAKISNSHREENQQCNPVKKARPSLLDSKRSKVLSKYEEDNGDGEEDYEESADEDDNVEEEVEEEDIDSAAAEEDENEEKQIEDFDYDDIAEGVVGNEITDPVLRVIGEGSGKECETGNTWKCEDYYFEDDDRSTVSDAIEEIVFVVRGEGSGNDCLVGNAKIEAKSSPDAKPDLSDGDAKSSLAGECVDTKTTNIIFSKSECVNQSSMKDTVTHETSISNKSQDSTEVSSLAVALEDKKTFKSITNEHAEESSDSENVKEDRSNGGDLLKKSLNINDGPHFEAKKEDSRTEDICTSQESSEEKDVYKPTCAKEVPESKAKQEKVCEKEPTKATIVPEPLKNEPQELKLKSLEKSDAPTCDNSLSALGNPTACNRKRRLEDFAFQQSFSTRHLNSESEIDINSEHTEEICNEQEFDVDEQDVGGKRLKMRQKQNNSELRKKVEAQKAAANDETTSSSGGEEGSRRRRKIISPKKHTERIVNKAESEDKTSHDDSNTNGQQQKCMPDKANVNAVEGNTPSTSNTSTSVVKHKPTLEEIIEKKLKKTHELEDKCNKISAENILTKTLFPAKKCPVTKPLKKNLLTQIRQEASQIEDITPIGDDLEITETKVILSTTADNQNNTTERQRKRHSSEEIDQNIIPEEPEAKKEVLCDDLNELDSKYRSDQITQTADSSECQKFVDIKDKINEDHARTDLGQTATTAGRRSGRRPVPVVYAEISQAKRTRGCHKKSETTQQHKQQLLNKEIEHFSKNDEPKPIQGGSKTSGNVPSLQLDSEVKTDVKNESEENIAKVSIKNESKIDSPNKAIMKGPRKQRDVDTTNIIDTTDAETPVRQSRRIAQQKIREEAERRKLEEIALRTMKQELKKKKKAEKQFDPTVLPPSEPSSESEESDLEMKKKVQKKKCPGKNGSWSSGSEEQEEPDEEEDEEHQRYETDPGSPLFKSDHEFSPESDIEDETQLVPTKRARTARKENALEDEKEEEEACQKCNKSDHPEWILLCDKCDKGYHCSCLSPVLFYIPEGDWYCPPCQQEQLIIALEGQLNEFDDMVERKKKEQEEEKRLAEEEKTRQEEQDKMYKQNNKNRKKVQPNKNDTSDGANTQTSDDDSIVRNSDESEIDTKKSVSKYKDGGFSKSRNSDKRNRHDRRQNSARSTRARAVKGDYDSDSGSQKGFNSDSASKSGSSSSSSYSDSDNEPIYKLRKRRQINVSYRLNEYDDLINSALKKEMDDAAGAGNLGRGKDISTIIEADKEEKARQKQLEDGDIQNEVPTKTETTTEQEKTTGSTKNATDDDENIKPIESDSDDEPIKRSRTKPTLKKKPRKLTTLDISSEDDDGSDEDFKGSSVDYDEEDTSVSASSNSDSSLEMYKRKDKSKKKRRKAARRAFRERRKDRRFVVDESDDDEDVQRPKSKKKRKDHSDYTESEVDDEDLSELSENIDSADLCDDTTTDESDGAWRPNKRKKSKKANVSTPPKACKAKPQQTNKPKKLEYSDDDISESEDDEENEDDESAGVGGGKQPRSQPLKTNTNTTKTKAKAKGGSSLKTKKKKKSSEEELSFSDSADSTRRTRGRRYAYIEDFDDDSSDGGIKPGVQRPDTPPEEREKFIKRQEEIKRMLAEKNAEGAKLAATPRLTPIKSENEKEKKSPSKTGADSLSTVPLSVIRQAKVLDIDYLQRRGENLDDLSNDVGDVDDDFDDADLPDDLPEDMDEDAIARMVEEEEDFGAAVAKELPPPDDVLRTPSSPVKPKPREVDRSTLPTQTTAFLNQPIQAPITLPSSGLQEPVRKRLPMPTIHPPLLRHQLLLHDAPVGHQMIQRHTAPTACHLLQNALSAPLTQSLPRTYPQPTASPNHHSLLTRMAHSLQMQHAVSPTAAPCRTPTPITIKSTQLNLQSQDKSAIQPTEPETKPRGRRKKITPLRDTLQKQQTAAAVAAAASASAAITAVATALIKASDPVRSSQPSVIKVGPPTKDLVQASVITSMQPTQSISGRPVSTIPGSAVYPGSEGFYGPPAARIPPSNTHRHRGPPQMPQSLLTSHSAVRHSYGPPPPLKGTINVPTSLAPSGNSVSAPRPLHHLPPYVGGPSTARHSASHLNIYGPSMYGNPNFAPRGNHRPPIHPSEYPTGSRAYPPYGFYPPPPPLTTPPRHQTVLQQPPPSVIVSNVPSIPSTSSPNVIPPTASVNSSESTSKPLTIKQELSIKRSPSNPPVPSATKASPESRKKQLTTLEAYTARNHAVKSPLPLTANLSTSRTTSPSLRADHADDSSQAVTRDTSPPSSDRQKSNEGQASEFSGLVSYFSSQHDDYNT